MYVKTRGDFGIGFFWDPKSRDFLGSQIPGFFGNGIFFSSGIAKSQKIPNYSCFKIETKIFNEKNNGKSQVLY